MRWIVLRETHHMAIEAQLPFMYEAYDPSHIRSVEHHLVRPKSGQQYPKMRRMEVVTKESSLHLRPSVRVQASDE